MCRSLVVGRPLQVFFNETELMSLSPKADKVAGTVRGYNGQFIYKEVAIQLSYAEFLYLVSPAGLLDFFGANWKKLKRSLGLGLKERSHQSLGRKRSL